MGREVLCSAIDKLRGEFSALDWTYHNCTDMDREDKMFFWPGTPEEEIIIVVHQSGGRQELFHRHDYFYFNYTYRGEYDSISAKYDNRITIREGELYAGQPFAGHALCVHDDKDTTIIGVLIRKDTFCKSFLPMLAADTKLFHFLLDPATDKFSDEYIHFKIEDDCKIRALLEMMVAEYANRQNDTQIVLKSLALAFLIQIARQYVHENVKKANVSLAEKFVQYIGEHVNTVTLKELGTHFSYHPNYVSTLLHRETGKSFSQILLEQRMERAIILLQGTALSVEEIALGLGYGHSSNFYKAFKSYFHFSPREFIKV